MSTGKASWGRGGGGCHPSSFSANVVGMAGLILWCDSIFGGRGILPELAFSTLWYPTFQPYPKDPVRTRAAKAIRDCCWTGKGTSWKKGSSGSVHRCLYNRFPRSIDITLNSSSQFANKMAEGVGNEQQMPSEFSSETILLVMSSGHSTRAT
eukprot:scaffold38301_cov55-Attheya_sp.AAC.3